MSAVLVRTVTYQADDMPTPETGTGVRWLQGWLVAFPDGTYEVVHDSSVMGVEPVEPARRRQSWRPWGFVIIALYALTVAVCTLLRMWLS